MSAAGIEPATSRSSRGERHSVSSEQGAQILLIVAPWPGDGHYPTDNPA